MDRDREDRDELWEDEDLFAVEGLDDDEATMSEGGNASAFDEDLFEVEAEDDPEEALDPDALVEYASADEANAVDEFDQAWDGFDPSVDEFEEVTEFAGSGTGEADDPIYGEVGAQPIQDVDEIAEVEDVSEEVFEWEGAAEDDLWDDGSTEPQELWEGASEAQAATPTAYGEGEFSMEGDLEEWSEEASTSAGHAPAHEAFELMEDVESFFGSMPGVPTAESESVTFDLGETDDDREPQGSFFGSESDPLSESELDGQEYAEGEDDLGEESDEWFDESDFDSASPAIDHGFQPSHDPADFETAPGLQAGALGELAHQDLEGFSSLDPDFEGFDLEDSAESEEATDADDREFVSWEEEGDAFAEDEDGFEAGTGAEEEPEFRDPHRPLELAARDADGYEDEYEEFEDELEEEVVAGPSRTRTFLLVGSVLAAACLVVLGKLLFLDENGTEDDMVVNPVYTARVTSAKTPPTPGVGEDPEAGPTGETSEETSTGEQVAVETPPGEGTETTPGEGTSTTPGTGTGEGTSTETVAESGGGGETTPPGEGTQPGTGEIVATGGEEVPPDVDPGTGTDPVTDLTPAEVSELFPEGTGEFVAEGAGPSEAEALLFKQDVRIPADAWAQPNRATQMMADVILHRSAVRILLKNGSEFRGNLHKLDQERIELKIEKGEISFRYEDLSEIFPLESPDVRLQHHPEGFVELKNHARLWGRIVENGPKAVTLAFGQTRILVPRHAVASVEERPMFLMSLEPPSDSPSGE